MKNIGDWSLELSCPDNSFEPDEPDESYESGAALS
jgi:hypothetical protein